MAKISVFECDICKTQSKKIHSVKFEIASVILSNGDNKPTNGNPVHFDCEVCSYKCAAEALARTFKKIKVEPAVFSPRTEILTLDPKVMS
jgi:ribosomal protein L44E